MEYKLYHSDTFHVTMTEAYPEENLVFLHLDAVSKEKEGADKLEIKVMWTIPDIGVHVSWTPTRYHEKGLVSCWGDHYAASCAMASAPVLCDLSYEDENRITVACSDAKNSVRLRTGLNEIEGSLVCEVVINVGCAIAQYRSDIRIDTRRIPFYQAIEEVSRWWETYDGYKPTPVPEDARMPMYSAWYSFNQNIDVPAIVQECKCFSALGCKTLIIDDGWHVEKGCGGYDYCGDWQPAESKIPDMKAFVDAVHQTGMKFMLWYSVPFIGEYTQAYQRFRDKLLYCFGGKTHVVDPRYPQVREYLIGLYRNAVLDWGLDGFKLDFVDNFRQDETVREGMDYVSVYDAVDRLLKDVIAALKQLKPDILIEFRHSYMGPLMRTFGTMLRAGDCACDSYTNRMNTLSLRLTSGRTPVHSDMVMWNYAESAEQAAFQLTNVLFSVPQISVRYHMMTQEQKEMVKAYLDFWTAHKETLLDGKMLYKGYGANYLYVSARSQMEQIGAVYTGQVAYLEMPTSEIYIFNATMEDRLILDSRFSASYQYTVKDCRGRETAAGTITVSPQEVGVINGVPVNGMVALRACYVLSHSDSYSVTITPDNSRSDVLLWHVQAECKDPNPGKLDIRLDWLMPDVGINAFWTPSRYHDKGIIPYWREFSSSCAMSSAPVVCNLAYNNENRLTLACLDARNSVQMRTGLYEGDGCMYCTVKIHVDGAAARYDTDICVDTRHLPFDQILCDLCRWWERNGGYAPAAVPEHARMPVYSSWYSFHQEVDAAAIVEECRHFAEMGCRTLIVDDGWQEDTGIYGYDHCGDWKPSPMKVPDMKAFVDAVHETGMKFLLWYGVPFVGEYSAAYERFKDKLLYCFGEKEKTFAARTHILDPRYPEVREYMVNVYRSAVLDWGVDGFKMDFVDSFLPSETVKEGMDFASVCDAVVCLFEEIMSALQKLKPDILIEFRHSYMGPLMRTFGTMLRSGDCACDSYTNRMNTLTLRIAGSGHTPVHSDMLMWNYGESAEQAAFQLTNVLFAVPQISVRYDSMTQEQREMMKHYLSFWTAHRNTLLDGTMLYKNYAANYPYVSARTKEEQIGAVYAGQVAYLEAQTSAIYLVNATLHSSLLVNSQFAGNYRYTITDCRGRETARGSIRLTRERPAAIRNVPVNGIVALHEC